MTRAAICASVSALVCFATAASAQDIEVSSLDIHQKRIDSPVGSLTNNENYIVDVSGKKVRIVGPRFFSATSNEIPLVGRADALAREEARSEFAAR